MRSRIGLLLSLISGCASGGDARAQNGAQPVTPAAGADSRWTLAVRPYGERLRAGSAARYWLGIRNQSQEEMGLCVRYVSYAMELDNGDSAAGSDGPSPHACTGSMGKHLVMPGETLFLLSDISVREDLHGRGALSFAVALAEECPRSVACVTSQKRLVAKIPIDLSDH